MRFLVDASRPVSTADTLRALGHDAVDVREIGMGGAHDDVIAAQAGQNGQVLVTRDFDFADTRNYPPAQYAGIAVLDLPNHFTATQVVRAGEAFGGTEIGSSSSRAAWQSSRRGASGSGPHPEGEVPGRHQSIRAVGRPAH